MTAPVLQFKRGLLANLPGLRAGEPGFTTDSYDLYVGIDSTTNNNKFFGSHRYWLKETTTTGSGINLVEGTSNGSDYVTLKSPDTLAGIVTYTLPGIQGASSSVLTNDGSGNLTWASGSANPVFTGIATFSDTTDNTLGDADTGAVQIDGGLGVNKNVTVGAGLSVTGVSHFIGTATFYGGQINLGDSDTDDIVVAGEFKSNLIPSDDATYNIGNSGKRWNNASFAGIGTFSTGLVGDNVRLGISGNGVVDTTSGPLYLDSASGNTIINDHLDVLGDIDVQGNVYIGGTTVTLRSEDVFIESKDIVLGYTTSITPNDDTANHAGVAIASTVGSPLVSFTASGINTLPDTYKQLMWFRTGTLGFATDAFAFNYGLAIGTTSMAPGIRLAVGSGITMSDTAISATNFYGTFNGNASSANQVKTVTASDTNASYYITFVDSHNGSATNETVYTDDGIYYNPGTNTFITQNAEFTGTVTISGVGTIVGTASTTSRAITVDTTGTSTNADYFVTFVDTLAGQTGETLRVGAGLSVNPSTGEVKTAGKLSVGDPGALTSYIKAGGGSDALYLYSNGDVAFQQKVIVGGLRSSSNSNNTLTLSDLDASFARNLTIAGIATVGTDVVVGSSLSAPTIKTATVQHINGTQAATVDTSGNITASQNLTVSGNLYVNGSTTQVNTTSVTVEDRTIELGLVDGSAPGSSTTWDLGVLFNYHDGSAKKSALVWEQSDARFKLGSVISASADGTGTSDPQITFSNYAALEIGSLWVNDCAGQSQVINCSGGIRTLENITIDGGQF